MESKHVIFAKILYIAAIITIVDPSKLNVPHVLLPIFNDLNVNFTLEAVNGGCYKWTTTRIDIVQLTLVDGDPDLSCSRKAIVSAISKERARNVAVVLAEDINTQLVLRVDVIVDVIDSLKISTTTKEIIMDEIPEIFKLVAFDNQGNLFTSLEGVEVDWKILCMGSKKDMTVLRFMTFDESPYETPPSVQTLEDMSRRGHIILLEGVKTGSAKVHASLPYEEYMHISPCEVQLSVVANIIIIPADVYLMVADVMNFKIYSMNNGKMEEIKLPNSQYYLDVEGKALASSNPQTGEITAIKEGKTRIVLHDWNVNEKDNGLKLPSATLHIVKPAYMTINLLPHKNFAVLLSEHHDILVEIFSSDDHKLHLGPGVEIHTQVGEIFHVQQRSQNGSWLTGWAENEGVARVQAVLKGVVHPKLGQSKCELITARNDILVYPRIILSPAEVILPWDPIAKPKYQVDLLATGGDGKFLWSSSNHSVGVVNQAGNVRTHSSGYFEVSAAMQRNHHNRETATFHILPPSRLEIVEYVMEAEVGSVIYLHVALFAEKPGKAGESPSHIPFTRCQDLPIKVRTSDTTFFHDKGEIISPVGISCANVAIIGNQVGSTKVSVTYIKDGKSLEDSVTVSAFKPLELVHPSQKVVLAVGTSIHLVYSGGPRPSLGRLSNFKRLIKVDNNSTVEAIDVTEQQNLPDSDYTVIKVLCRQLGETDVALSITNAPAVPNCKNQDTKSTVKVICGKPRSVYLQPEIKVADVKSCPMDLSSDKVVVQSKQDVELGVTVKDENGLKFLNISSLKFAWTAYPPEQCLLGSKDSTIHRIDLKGSIDFGTKYYQVVKPKVEVGQIEVRANIVGYHKNVLAAFKIKPEWPEFIDEHEKGTELPPVVTSISLYLVDDTVVTPNEITLYNHPMNKKSIAVKQGSGYYELALSVDDVAEVRYMEGSREIEIIPQNNGELRINLIDLCLVSRPAVILVSIVSVSIIRVEMSDKVEIGKCIPCIVKLYDDSDNLLHLPDLDMVDLKHNLEMDIANVKKQVQKNDVPWGDGEIHYIITGQDLGDTKLTFSVPDGRGEITSAPLDLQVFPPMYLFPRNTTLLIGSSLQYNHKGGPQPDSSIEYITAIHEIADVTSSGLVKGLALGNTKVNARALGVNPTTGQKVIYAQDSVDVTVIPIVGVKISAPLTRFQLGATVPMWATGLPEQLSPMILGTVEPPLTYNWAVDDPDIAEIKGVFQDIGVNYGSEDQVSIRVKGLIPGRTKLYLNVTVPGILAKCTKKQFVVLSDTVDIEVFEGLVLTAPKGVSGKLVLMAPHSSIQLQTNMDSLSTIRYKLLGEESPRDHSQKSLMIPDPLVTVTETGLLESHGYTGYSMVLIISTDSQGLKQTVSIIVEVKPIYYMMLSVTSNWLIHLNSPDNVIPLGTEIELKASYHDNTGNMFTAGTAELNVRTSRFDLIRIKPGFDNSSLIVSTKKSGYTVIKVWANGIKKTADYIKLNVRQTITPSVDQLVTGDIVCLWTPVISSSPGKWTSSDTNLLNVDSETGIGTVVNAKVAQVSILHNLHPAASLQLQVLPATQVIILRDLVKKSLTHAPSKDIFRVPLVLINTQNLNKRSNLMTDRDCRSAIDKTMKTYPFTCEIKFTNSSIEINPTSVFSVRSSFSLDNGVYSCDVYANGINDPLVSTLESNITIVTSMNNHDVKSDSVEVEFIPAIYLENELTLDVNSYSAVLVIIGIDSVLDEVTVTPGDKQLLKVKPPTRPSKNELNHQVELIDYHWKLDEFEGPLDLYVYSKLTDQHIKVHVKIQSGDSFHRPECAVGGKSPLSAFIYNNRQTLTILVSMMIIFGVTFYAYSHYVQPVVCVNVTQNRSLLGGPNLTSMNSFRPDSPTFGSPNQCAAVAYTRRSPNQTSFGGNVTHQCAATREPVYGDPTSFYCTSPELRRNRRFM